MRRKIIKQGHGTLTVTLPSQWTKKVGLKPGDEVDIIEKDEGIFIGNKETSNEKATEFDITGMNIPTIWKYFMAVYREGYTKIEIRFPQNMVLENPYKFFTKHRADNKHKNEPEKKEIIDALQIFVDRFIGLEIVKHTANSILVHEMGSPTIREFNNSLRRVLLLVQQMADETLESIQDDKPQLLSHIHSMDVNLDKFHDYCIRILNQIGTPNHKKLLFSTLYLLELIGDEFKNIAIHIIKDYKKKKFKNIADFAKAIKEQCGLYYNLFYKYDNTNIKKISEIDKNIYFETPKMYKKASEEEKEVLHHLRMVGTYINALVELRIEMEF